MAQMKVHGISDKVMGLSSPRTMFFISLEPVKVFCQICPTRFFKDQKDPVFQGLRSRILRGEPSRWAGLMATTSHALVALPAAFRAGGHGKKFLAKL